MKNLVRHVDRVHSSTLTFYVKGTLSMNKKKEELAKEKPIHVAITYTKDGTITRYREGQVYGETYKTAFQKYDTVQERMLFLRKIIKKIRVCNFVKKNQNSGLPVTV